MPVCISHDFFFRWERTVERQGRYMYYFEKGKGNTFNVPLPGHTERREGEMARHCVMQSRASWKWPERRSFCTQKTLIDFGRRRERVVERILTCISRDGCAVWPFRWEICASRSVLSVNRKNLFAYCACLPTYLLYIHFHVMLLVALTFSDVV